MYIRISVLLGFYVVLYCYMLWFWKK